MHETVPACAAVSHYLSGNGCYGCWLLAITCEVIDDHRHFVYCSDSPVPYGCHKQ
jgi:hypothetical protein